MATAIYYKYGDWLTHSTSEKFDEIHEPGTPNATFGVYRCEGCGKEVTSVSQHPLPPQNHHQHELRQGKIRWRLVVLG